MRRFALGSVQAGALVSGFAILIKLYAAPTRYEASCVRSSPLKRVFRKFATVLNQPMISWKAQHRLHSRYARLMGRGKSKQLAMTAVARELAGFVWAVGVEVERQLALRPARAA
jgi:hypothetical protein